MTESRIVDYGFTIVRPFVLSKDSRTALVIIDMQYHDASADGGWNLALEAAWPGSTVSYIERVEQVALPCIQSLLAYFRSASLPVVHVTVGSDYKDYRDLSGRFREQLLYLERVSGLEGILWFGNPQSAIREELAPFPNESVVRKRTTGAFNGSSIDEILRQKGIENLVFTGVATSACVAATAIDAADRGYESIMVEEAVADTDLELHDGTLRVFHANHGRVLRAADDVIRAIESAEPV